MFTQHHVSYWSAGLVALCKLLQAPGPTNDKMSAGSMKRECHTLDDFCFNGVDVALSQGHEYQGITEPVRRVTTAVRNIQGLVVR